MVYLCNRNEEHGHTHRAAPAAAVPAGGSTAADAGELPAAAEKVVHGVLLPQPHQDVFYSNVKKPIHSTTQSEASYGDNIQSFLVVSLDMPLMMMAFSIDYMKYHLLRMC